MERDYLYSAKHKETICISQNTKKSCVFLRIQRNHSYPAKVIFYMRTQVLEEVKDMIAQKILVEHLRQEDIDHIVL